MNQVLHGIVEPGDARGRQLGFPTANLPIHGQGELDGIWAARAAINGAGSLPATVSIGRRPTYYRNGIRLAEAHLLDFQGDIYGSHLSIELVSFIRPQVKCSSDAELIALIADDVNRTRSIVNHQAHAYDMAMAGTGLRNGPVRGRS